VKIAIGLPTTIAGVTGGQVVEWARRADTAGFSSLGTTAPLPSTPRATIVPGWPPASS
jgi:hypothetical protein